MQEYYSLDHKRQSPDATGNNSVFLQYEIQSRIIERRYATAVPYTTSASTVNGNKRRRIIAQHVSVVQHSDKYQIEMIYVQYGDDVLSAVRQSHSRVKRTQLLGCIHRHSDDVIMPM